jgi:heme-degrading monooxygenase HmoA
MIVHLWEYRVPAASEAAFVAHYASDGVWVRLFRRGNGHVETRLLRDPAAPGRYVTVDVWESDAAYAAFRERFAAEYAALDDTCAALTTSERCLGTFVSER